MEVEIWTIGIVLSERCELADCGFHHLLIPAVFAEGEEAVALVVAFGAGLEELVPAGWAGVGFISFDSVA